MTEEQAWMVLETYARQGRVTISRSMTINVLRRTLAKKYQPRKATDDGSAMRAINPAIDVIERERDRRELLGVAEPRGQNVDRASAKPSATPNPSSQAGASRPRGPQTKSGQRPVWQTDFSDTDRIERPDYTDANYIRKTVYERSARIGDVELIKAWAWDGERFRKVITAWANDYAYEMLSRALLVLAFQESTMTRCDAVFLTKGDGRATKFRLALLRIGRGYVDVSRYNLDLSIEPDDPTIAIAIPAWLEEILRQINAEQSG